MARAERTSLQEQDNGKVTISISWQQSSYSRSHQKCQILVSQRQIIERSNERTQRALEDKETLLGSSDFHSGFKTKEVLDRKDSHFRG